MYNGLKEKVSVWADSEGVTPYRVSTNSDGLRNEEILQDKPESQKRVLIIGDSYTFGWGVNQSNVYTDVVEKKLSQTSESRIEVINPGVPAYGAKDYYKYLKFYGTQHNPDIVVLGLHPSDWYSNRQWDEFYIEASRKVQNRSKKPPTEDQISKKVLELVEQDYRETRSKNTGLRYLNSIRNLTSSNNATLILFKLKKFRPKHETYLREWSDTHNATLVAAERFIESESRTQLSRADTHPDPCGHRLIAKDLYPVLKRRLQNTSSQPDRSGSK